MTREEAIRIIETVFQDEYVYKYYDSITHQALDMAIEALSAPQNNLISREDAVKTVIRKCSPICAWQVGTQQYPDCVVAEINALPSAEAETKCVAQIKVDTEELVRRIKEEHDITAEWIPCSERLPEKDDLVLVTVWNDVVLAWRNRYGGWESVEDMYEKGDVIAWMPLPKPYRESGEVTVYANR